VTSFDLLVATVGRVDELDNLLASLDAQTYRCFRALVIDQNEDDSVPRVLARHTSLPAELHRSPKGLSRARNAALPRVRADVVAFPDDDCVYPHDLLARVAARLGAEPQLAGLVGRDDRGTWPTTPGLLTRTNLWSRAISFTIFLRAPLVEQVGSFDERLGLPASSGEEIDYLIRAIDVGARIEYDPSLVVHHDATERPLAEVGARDGHSIGYMLRKHRYPLTAVARMLVRPLGGALLAAAHGDGTSARFHAATLRGRISGYLSTSSAKSLS
jgi:glycosyltransferase involved in cell wall biosynthesis